MMTNKNFAYVYGVHAVMMLLQQTPHLIEELYVRRDRHDQRMQKIIKLATLHHVKMIWSSSTELDMLLPKTAHQGVIATKKAEKNSGNLEEFIEQLDHPAFLLILDGVQDPHNLGACLRTANAAGVDAVIAPKDRATGITPVVRKVASGAAEITPFYAVTNLARTLQWLKEKNIWIYGAAEEAQKNIYELNFSGAVAMVMGAEGEGLRRLTREHCDELFRIPTVGEISSLNVSVATGICLFEVLRQRA
jgi:23S rRNA (guanosine2251-2'-O)-methyltransferase